MPLVLKGFAWRRCGRPVSRPGWEEKATLNALPKENGRPRRGQCFRPLCLGRVHCPGHSSEKAATAAGSSAGESRASLVTSAATRIPIPDLPPQ
jgi:hypothetical protein